MRHIVLPCLLALLAVLFAGCATRAGAPVATPSAPAVTAPLPAPGPALTEVRHYSCEQGIAFALRLGDGSAQIDLGSNRSEMLQRDAGGLTPRQAVYSNTSAKVELGLGAQGREAKLNLVAPPLEVRCSRD